LKEWQVAVDALEKGETVMLLRKGGIREAGGRFSVVHDRVLLYPTYEHQQPHLLKANYASQVKPVDSGWHPDLIRIGSWADVTDTIQVSAGDRVAALMPFHIWNETFIQERLKWKPHQPLYILLLRIYKLNSPQWIPYNSAYGGCKSWIDLTDAIALEGTPVLSDSDYHQMTAAIHTIGTEC
jgi:Uncharacterized protein conserved in bacteria